MGKSIRQLWTNKLSKCTDTSSVSVFFKKKQQLEPQTTFKKQFTGIILGIDPSLRGTGIAIIDFSKKDQPSLIFSTKITIPKKFGFIESISKISNCIEEILVKHSNINACSIEQTIFVQNYQVAQILGAVRGAIISTVSRHNIQVEEYAPLRVKQATVGTGKASKEQVSKTVKSILNISNLDLSLDETDAIAVALCHAWTSRI